jgi:hypothetical protein
MAPPIPAAMSNAHHKAAHGLSLGPHQLWQLGDIRRKRPNFAWDKRKGPQRSLWGLLPRAMLGVCAEPSRSKSLH